MNGAPALERHRHGFVRVAAACPTVRLANPAGNAAEIAKLAALAHSRAVDVCVFPELSLTGYTCGDLFLQRSLLDAAWESLWRLIAESKAWPGMTLFVGLPLRHRDRLYNAAACVRSGSLLGVVPKSHLPNYNEFYEQRHFSSGKQVRNEQLDIPGGTIPFGTDLLFELSRSPVCRVGVEICEDLWVPSPPSSQLAQQGANLLVNLSASNAVVGKAAFRRVLVAAQSGRCLATYVYASAGPGESTTDLVFDGDGFIYENGTLLAATVRFAKQGGLAVADTDLSRLESERWKFKTFADGSVPPARLVTPPEGPGLHPGLADRPGLERFIDAHPFVPASSATLAERCLEIFQTQVCGLATRLEGRPFPRFSIGVSGGLDSTLALLVACKVADRLEVPRSRIDGVTMPGFGTTGRTLANAERLMTLLGVSQTRIDIKEHAFRQMKAMGHRPFGIDLTQLDTDRFVTRLEELVKQSPSGSLDGDLVFENVQARLRTAFLMNRGFVIGTGDISELALGWCTYNADQTSMYNPNASIPKTLVRFLVRWAAENEFEGEVRDTLLDICATPISPELLPTGRDGSLVQETEKSVGPYELHDFFLFHFLRYGAPPEKILYLSQFAKFSRPYTAEERNHWLSVFVKRFFSQQFKRSCLPDGPKVGTISLSPRGDWRMPSDANATSWLEQMQEKISGI